MNARGFAILLVIAVAASIAWGLIVERFTAPGLERTLWFGIGLAAIVFPAGWFAERRGWVSGMWRGADTFSRGGPPTAESSSSSAGTPPASDTRSTSADKS